MNWLLEHKLKDLGRQGNPDPAFVRALEKRLRQELGHPAWWIHWSKVTAAATTIVLLTGSATGAYAYTSDNVLPDSALYPIRQGLETIETAVALTPTARTAVQIKHLQRRLHEQELMAAKQRPITKEKLNDAADSLDEALKDSGSLSTSTQTEIDQTITTIEIEHEKNLLNTRDAAPTADEKAQIEDLVERQRDHVQTIIDSLQSDRKSHFSELKKKQLDTLHQRLDRLNKQIRDLGDEGALTKE